MAQSLAFQRLLEENLYFVLLYSRWVDESGWKAIKKEFSPLFPFFLGTPFLRLLRRELRQQAFSQGIGRHSREEIYQIGARDLLALSSFLGKKNYFMGENWTPIDATLFAFLSTIAKQPFSSPLQDEYFRHENLVEYCRREEKENSEI